MMTMKSITTDKKKYQFYISYWESYKMLTSNEEKVEFIEVINKIHFFEEHIDNIDIKNNNVKLLFASIKHSLKASIQGYCDKKAIIYDDMFINTLSKGVSKGVETPLATINKEQLIINNKEIESNKPDSMTLDFKYKEFLHLYPIKTKRGFVLEEFKLLTSKEINEILLVVNSEEFKSYAAEKGKYLQEPHNWLKSKSWLDDYSEYKNNTSQSIDDGIDYELLAKLKGDK